MQMSPERAAEHAQRLLDDPVLVGALGRLEAQYLDLWRNSLPEDREAREDAYHALRGLTAFRADLKATLTAPDFTSRQKLRSK